MQENSEQRVKNIRKILGNAIRGEMETENTYRTLSEMTDSIFLKERFKFLAGDVVEQRKFLKKFTFQIFKEDIELPESSGLPLPEIKTSLGGRKMPLEELIDALEKVKDAEKGTHDAYISISKLFDLGSPERKLLEFLAFLKNDRYLILGRKIERLKKFGLV